jgi:Zn-dependent peptidase ImmA (M78 family)
MPDRIQRNKISKKVEELLQKFDVRRPPVPVDKLVKKLGILLAPLPGEDDISGAIIRKDGRVVIAVNPAHHINRQRFTIGHEMGHYFLHEGLETHVDQNFRVAWRNAESSKAVDWNEIQANRFAAEILMPTRFLLKDLDSLEVIDRRTVVLLANRYAVSPDAMKIRLTQLGITGPFGDPTS